MLREFTKDRGRYRKGDMRDYPAPTWRALAGREPLDSFTRAVNLPPEVLLSATRQGALREPAKEAKK